MLALVSGLARGSLLYGDMSEHHPSRPLPAPSPLASHWPIDPGIVYLNHGSFGGCPSPVIEAQQRYRLRMERELVRFFVEDMDDIFDQTRAEVAAFVRCKPGDLAFVPNATTGVATILNSFALRPGDDVLAGMHEYPACMNNLRHICAKAGANVVTAPVPFPVTSPGQIVEAVLSKVTPRTKLALLSHVTSSSGIILPIREMVAALSAKGIETIVDGAHAVGMLDLDIPSIGAAFYTANCHKWVCSPKGSAILYVREDWQPRIRPVVLSNFAEKPKPGRSQFHTEFDYIGTDDPTAYFAIADAIKFMGSLLPGGWEGVRRHNHELLKYGRQVVSRVLGTEPPAPESMLGSICTMYLPRHDAERTARLAARTSKYHDATQDELIRRHRIQVPLWSVAGTADRVIRISAQVYNSREQYDYLAAALEEEMARERAF